MSTQPLYLLETLLKVGFLPMSLLNLPYTFMIAVVTSILGVVRICKTPQFSKEYAQRMLQTTHGQNLLYLGMGALGPANYLFYSPLALYFAFALVEFANMKLKTNALVTKYAEHMDFIRNHKYYIMEGKCRLEIAYFFFLVVSLPLGFLQKIMKVMLMGQYLLLKYRISQEFQHAAAETNRFFDDKTKSVGFINSVYQKIAGMVYSLASSGANPSA